MAEGENGEILGEGGVENPTTTEGGEPETGNESEGEGGTPETGGTKPNDTIEDKIEKLDESELCQNTRKALLKTFGIETYL